MGDVVRWKAENERELPPLEGASKERGGYFESVKKAETCRGAEFNSWPLLD